MAAGAEPSSVREEVKKLTTRLAQKEEELTSLRRAFTVCDAKLQVFTQALEALNRVSSAQELLESITELAISWTKAEAGSLLLIDESKKELYFKVALGPKGEAVKSFRLKMGEGIAGWSAARDQVVSVSDASRDARFKSEIAELIDFPAHSILALPVRQKGKVLGVFEMVNKEGGAVFTPEDVDTLSTIATIAGIFLGSIVSEKLVFKKSK